jgi:signal transduction histidine kinase
MTRLLENRHVNPMKALTFGLVLAVMLLPALGFLVWSMYGSLLTVGTEGLRLQRLVGDITHLNEVLTMSARMASATGDPRWERHYRLMQPRLDDSILEAALLLRAEYEKSYAAQTKLAYSQLLEIESVALAMVRQGRLQEASALLFGTEYEAQKALYSQGIDRITASIQKRIEEEIAIFRRRIWEGGFLAVVSLTIVILGWAGVSLVVKRHLLRHEEDVTERMRLEEQLRQAAKMEALGTLAGGIAHDFNNIIYVIMGFSELALDRAEKGGQIQSSVKQILAASNRAKALVDQILTFSRGSDREKKVVRLSPLIKETLRFLRASVPATVELHELVEPGSDTIMGDPNQIHQVLMNLGTNAVHAMREKGGALEIRLSSQRFDAILPPHYPQVASGSYVKLSVSDTGHGMTPAELEHIFEPYFTTKNRGEGTGLGLSVVHGIVKAHGGFMDVRSEVGKGSTFSVYLPAAADAAVSVSDAGPEVSHGVSERPQPVDGEAVVVNMRRPMLQPMSCDQ